MKREYPTLIAFGLGICCVIVMKRLFKTEVMANRGDKLERRHAKKC